jgi:hypothetical protein
LALVTGSLFADIEAKAALWQRPRRAPAMRRTATVTALSDGTADVAGMVAAFQLATANLQEIWSLVLPPNSLLMLKRCSVLDAAEFRLPDNLWARIVFDFLIAYRLRAISMSLNPEPQPRATLKQLPRLLKRINPTWSRAGVGLTGSTHDRVSTLEVDERDAIVRGENAMQNLVTNTVQQASHTTPVSPVYANDVSIWNHMSDALHQSLYRVLTLLIAVLPGILAFFVALVIFAVAGMAVSWILRRCLTWAKFDLRMARKSGTDWTPATSPTEIIARASFWVCVLLGLIIGVSAFDTSYATGTPLPISLLPYLTRSVSAVLLLVAGILIARFLARSVLISAVNAQLQYARVLSLGVKWLVLVLTAAMVLDHLEVGGNIVELAFGILFGGIVLTLSLAVGLGSRDLVSRSLESRVEHTSERVHTPEETAGAEKTLRHF